MTTRSETKALTGPSSPITAIASSDVKRAVAASRSNRRRRVILPFHKSPDDRLHRMLNAIQPDSYIRPHCHLHPPKTETVLVLQGALLCLVFDDDGAVRTALALKAGGDPFGFDCEAGIYHTFLALTPDTVIFEVKPGPYEQASDKDFAAWAPPEDSPKAAAYLENLRRLGLALTTDGSKG